MKPETQRRLNAINRDFYAAIAEDFSETRADAWPGWERVLRALPFEPGKTLSVLDLGCGNGRFARFLDQGCRHPVRYLGVDACEGLLELAREAAPRNLEPRFEYRDVLVEANSESLPDGPFDLIVLFGLLHHVPAREARRALLARCSRALSPGGVLVVTAWRFGAFERFRSRYVSWQDYNSSIAAPGRRIDTADLEAGDHLLGWRDDPLPRYCHYVDRDELTDLLTGLPVRAIDRFEADGKTEDLNDYAIVQRM